MCERTNWAEKVNTRLHRETNSRRRRLITNRLSLARAHVNAKTNPHSSQLIRHSKEGKRAAACVCSRHNFYCHSLHLYFLMTSTWIFTQFRKSIFRIKSKNINSSFDLKGFDSWTGAHYDTLGYLFEGCALFEPPPDMPCEKWSTSFGGWRGKYISRGLVLWKGMRDVFYVLLLCLCLWELIRANLINPRCI